MNGHILEGLVFLSCIGALGQWLAHRLGVPSILLLLLSGFVVGPILGLLDPDELLGPVIFPLVSLGAALILFEGGLSARVQDLRPVLSPVLRLVTIGLVSTWVLITLAAHLVMGLAIDLSILLGAILVVTGPTVIGPLLRHARPQSHLSQVLKFEGILNDPVGALLAVLVFQVLEAEGARHALSSVVLGLVKTAVLSSSLGVVFAWGYCQLRVRGWLPSSLENAVLIPSALAAFTLGNFLQHESGLVTVTVMGMYLASQKKIDIEANLEFTEHARTMLISVLFILLTARMELSDFSGLSWSGAVFVLLLLAVVRPVSVLLASSLSGMSLRERLFLSAVAPRGIVAAAVASVFGLRLVELGREDGEILMPVTFSVIAAGVVVYGLTAAPLTRALGLRQRHPTGIVCVGANHLARVLAGALAREGFQVTLVDSSWAEVSHARQAGLHAVYGRALSPHVLDRIDVGSLGTLLALTSNDEVNALSAAHFRRQLGGNHVHQLVPSQADGTPQEDYASQLRGNVLSPHYSYEILLSALQDGAVAKVTGLTQEFGYVDLLDAHEGRLLPLLAFRPGRPVRPIPPGASPPEAGERVLGLLLPDGREAQGRDQARSSSPL